VERVEIASIAAGGEGTGRLADGRAVFVHRTAPGETVDIHLSVERPRWARGRLLRVITPSPDRRAAPCEHYAGCGGCTLEHLEYSAQLRAKSRIVADAFARIGGFPIDPPEVVASPKEFRYRNRVSFTLRRLGSGRVVAGFHALHEADRIVSVDGACLLPEVAISRVWDELRGAWGHNANLLPSGETLRLTLRATSAGGVTLLIEGGHAPGDPERLLAAVPGLDAVWHRRREGEAVMHLAGASGVAETWGDEAFEVGGAVFLQVNRSAAALLEAWVEELIIGPPSPEGGYPDEEHLVRRTIVDAYCGIGVRARRLARRGARVIGIELDASAVAIAEAAPVAGASFHAVRVEDLLPATLPADLVVLNPPRAGIDASVAAALVEVPPERIIYVSCDPATLARDMSRLADRFSPRSVRCFDLFPQTAHVETVTELVRRQP